MSAARAPIAFLFDVDNTLLDNDRVRRDLVATIDGAVGTGLGAHKEDYLDEVERRLPAERYVLVDDKPRILAAAKERLGDRLITLHVCQGRYAHAAEHDTFPPADRSVNRISDILSLDLTTIQEYTR